MVIKHSSPSHTLRFRPCLHHSHSRRHRSCLRLPQSVITGPKLVCRFTGRRAPEAHGVRPSLNGAGRPPGPAVPYFTTPESVLIARHRRRHGPCVMCEKLWVPAGGANYSTHER